MSVEGSSIYILFSNAPDGTWKLKLSQSSGSTGTRGPGCGPTSRIYAVAAKHMLNALVRPMMSDGLSAIPEGLC
jgi:hypothetical protein